MVRTQSKEPSSSNGHDRFSEEKIFNLVQPYQHHENVPATGINVYSFGLCLKNTSHQVHAICPELTLPSSLNSLRRCRRHSSQVRVYATNYNVLRIMGKSHTQLSIFIFLYKYFIIAELYN